MGVGKHGREVVLAARGQHAAVVLQLRVGEETFFRLNPRPLKREGIRSSLWRHGSIAHGPQPRDYSYALPKGMLRGALRSALAAKFQDHKLTVVDQFNLGEVKTKGFASALQRLGVEKGVLVVDDAVNHNLELSSRNVKGCDLVRRHELHPYHVVSHNQLLISEGALARLQEALR